MCVGTSYGRCWITLNGYMDTPPCLAFTTWISRTNCDAAQSFLGNGIATSCRMDVVAVNKKYGLQTTVPVTKGSE